LINFKGNARITNELFGVSNNSSDPPKPRVFYVDKAFFMIYITYVNKRKETLK